MNLGTAVFTTEPFWQCGEGLEGREGACRGIEAVGGYAAALLVGDINDIFLGVENEVAWAHAGFG